MGTTRGKARRWARREYAHPIERGTFREDERLDPLDGAIVVVGHDAAERGLGAAHRREGGQRTARPLPSPCSAPGGVRSQATSRASISSPVAPGWSRRSCVRRTDSPISQRSSAARKRAATASAESSVTTAL